MDVEAGWTKHDPLPEHGCSCPTKTRTEQDIRQIPTAINENRGGQDLPGRRGLPGWPRWFKNVLGPAVTPWGEQEGRGPGEPRALVGEGRNVLRKSNSQVQTHLSKGQRIASCLQRVRGVRERWGWGGACGLG